MTRSFPICSDCPFPIPFPNTSFDNSDDEEMNDDDLEKLLVIVQTPESKKGQKHDGKDRTGFHRSRAKTTAEWANHINNELYFYEQASTSHSTAQPVPLVLATPPPPSSSFGSLGGEMMFSVNPFYDKHARVLSSDCRRTAGFLPLPITPATAGSGNWLAPLEAPAVQRALRLLPAQSVGGVERHWLDPACAGCVPVHPPVQPSLRCAQALADARAVESGAVLT